MSKNSKVPTEAKTKIQELEAAVAAADATAQMKANFLATMSHEMRTPMQTVYGFLELIELEKPQTNIQEMVTTAKGSASSLLEILDDILDFAKIDAEKMELDHFEVPVRTLVRGTLEALGVKVQSGSVELIDNIAEDVPFVVIGDPKRLRQILMNLAGNALKFTREGSVSVNVTVKRQKIKARDGIVLRFEIVDTGIGMPEEVSQQLFQPFTQADGTTARKYGGTGLGLSISKRLVELMGGEIGVKSVEGEGSRFWFEIPTKEVSIDTNSVDLPDLEGVSVLSVEDHPQGAKEIKRSLESMGADVESCGTIAEAMSLVRRRPFDVGVIDQGLPDGLGINCIREMMRVRPFMGLIMYTVRDDVGLQHTCQSLGVSYLSKPASRLGLGGGVKSAAQKTVTMDPVGPRRLLIAEDTLSVQEVLKRQLEKLQVEVEFVQDGQQALEALKKTDYGILFTDLHMPEIDGYEVISKIRMKEEGTERRMPVVVLTADVQVSQQQAYVEYGFDECLLKPVSMGQLRRLLYRWGLIDEEMLSPGEEPPPAYDPVAVMPSAKGNKPAIDVASLATQMGSSEEEAQEMLGQFINMTETLVQQVQQNWDNRDMHGLRESAHSLKGAARSACCIPLGEAAAELQDAASSGEATLPLVNQIWRRFTEVEQAVNKL